MTFRNSRLFITIVILLTVGIIAFAQFERWGNGDGGVLLRYVKNIEFKNSTAQDSDGNIAVLWEEIRIERSVLVAQCINSNNQKLWGDEGLEINIEANSCIHNDIKALNDGTWIVVTLGSGIEGLDSRNIYLQRIDDNGAALWGDGGVVVCNSGMAYSPVRIFPSIVNGELEGINITWHDGRTGAEGLYSQKVGLDGTLQWNENGVCIASVLYNSTQYKRFQAFADNSGGVVACWWTSLTSDRDLRLQRVSSSGEMLWGESIIITESARYIDPAVVADGNEGFYVAWTDYNSDTEDELLCVQYLDPDGNKIWSEDNETMAVSTELKWQVELVPADDGCIAVWTENDDAPTIYMQKFSNLNSNLNIHWGGDEYPNGLLLSGSVFGQLDPFVIPDGSGGFVACWREGDQGQGTQHQMRMQWIDENGNTNWETDTDYGIDVGRVTRLRSSKSLFYSLHMKDEEVVLINSDIRLNDRGVFLQRYTDSGNIILEVGGIPVGIGRFGSVREPLPVVSDNNVYISWEAWGAGRSAHVQKIDPLTGNTEFRDDGITLTPGLPEVTDEDTLYAWISSLNFIPDQQGGVIASWREESEGHSGESIRAQRITPEGDILWGDFGSEICRSNSSQNIYYAGVVALADENGGAFLAYKVQTTDEYILAFQHIDENGNRLLSEGDLPYISIDIGMPLRSVIAVDRFDNGNIIVLFNCSSTSNGTVLKAVLVDDNGALVLDEPVQFSNIQRDFYSGKMVKVEGGFVVSWGQFEGTNNVVYMKLLGQKINSDGSLEWQFEEGKEFSTIRIVDSGFFYSTSAFGENSDTFWLSWLNDQNLIVQKYNMDGEELLSPSEGITVSQNIRGEYPSSPSITVGQHGDAFVSWKARETNGYSRKFTHLDSNGQPFDDYSSPDSLIFLNSDVYHENLRFTPYYEGEFSGFVAVWESSQSETGWQSNVYAQLIMDEYTTTSDAPEYVKAPIPEKYVLHSAYPNPFNPTSIIAVGLPTSSELKVKVYNMLGKEVATLVDGKCASGYHAFQFDASDLASGIYFVKAVVAGKMNQTQKIVLMK
jgi:Secretion system C-terminal sorting domain